MIPGWMKKTGPNEPDSMDSFAVFLLAIAWATFAGSPLRQILGEWSVAAFTCGLFLIPVGFAFLRGFRMVSTFRLKMPVAREAVAGIILAAGMLLAVIVCGAAVSALFPQLPVSGKTLRTNVNDPDFFRLILSVVLLPAVCEETLFRGFILSGLDRGAGRARTALLCGLLFGLLHMEPVQIPFTAAVGFGLSWIALESGSLAIPVFMHAFHNLMLLAIARFGLPRFGFLFGFGGRPDPAALAFFLTAISAVSMACIVAGIRLAKRNPSRDPFSPGSFP